MVDEYRQADAVDRFPADATSKLASAMRPRPSRRSTRSVTLTDVAMVAGVSQQTVSRAIRSPLLVSEATLERVKWAIGTTGYVPNLTASNLASNRSMTVAAIIPVISLSIFADAVHELEEVLASAGYGLLLGTTHYQLDQEEEVIRTLLGRRPDGFFIVGTNHTPVATMLLRRSGIPIVEAWDMEDNPLDCLVGYSNADATAAIVEYAVGRGYQRPTFAGTVDEFRSAARLQGFEGAVHRLLPGHAVRVVRPTDGSLGMDTGKSMLHEALRQYPDTDVLICSSDNFAAGALLECVRLGIDVPGSLAITGFGDFEMARHLVPGLTSVATPNREIGKQSAEILIQRMRGQPVDQTSLNLGFAVVPRASA